MSLPEGLERLLRAAYEAGAKGETSAKTALEKTLERIESMDSTQPGVYGTAAKDFLTHVRNSLSRCPRCGHAPHGSWCANMASDNDCSCTYDPAAEWIDTIEMGDRLSAIADLADATSPELPSLYAIGTPVQFREGSFVVRGVNRSTDGGTSIELEDASRFLQNRTVDDQKIFDLLQAAIPPAQDNYYTAGPPSMAEPVVLDDRPGVRELGKMEHAHLRTTRGTICLKDRSGLCKVPTTRSTRATATSERRVRDCEECHARVDDEGIDDLGYKRYGRHLCVRCYVAEGKKKCACEWEASPPNIACPIHREKP